MPTPHEVMDATRKRHLEEAAQVDQDMRDLERIVSKYKLLVVAPVESFTSPSSVAVNRAIFGRAQKEGETIIRTAGHPLQIDELFHRLSERGITLGGQSPSGALSACLARNYFLRYIPQIGWWLKGVSWPPKPDEVGLIGNPPADWKEELLSNRTRGRTAQKDRLYQEIRKLLEGRAEPVPFSRIYDHITKSGIPIGGTNERQNLATFLCANHEFRSRKREGWRFVPEPPEESDPSEADSAGAG